MSGPGQAGSRGAPRWLAAAALAAVWAPPLLRLSRVWTAGADQAYGWSVPPLAALLAWERWRRRPEPVPPGRLGRAVVVAAGAAGLALLVAGLPVLEANADWPTAQWAVAAGAAAATLAGLALAGGVRWAAHFAFPVAFVSTALTWPTPVHLWIVRDLAGTNAALAASIVSALGHPAVVNGNVIAVSTGFVGVDEACSGLRSLQAVWMAAWFCGELFALNWPRRLVLVAAALAAATAANLARTSFLTWEGAAHGLEATERWHDRAAAAELAATLAVVALLAWRASRPSRGKPASRGAPAPVARARWPLGWSLAALAAGAFAEAGTQAWYLAHERRAPAERVQWSLASPGPDWRPVAVPARALEVLQSTAAAGLAFSDPRSALRAWAFVVTWTGDAAQGENPEWHDPTICLPSSGVKQTADLGTFPVRIGGVRVAFTGYRFDDAGRPLDVFFCHWDAALGEARSEGDDVDLRIRRLERVRDGRRRGDVAHLALEVEGTTDAGAAAWLRDWAPKLLRPERG